MKQVGHGLGEITIRSRFIREVYTRKVGSESNSIEGQLKQMEQVAKEQAVKEGIGKLLNFIQQRVTNPQVMCSNQLLTTFNGTAVPSIGSWTVL